MAKPKIWRLVFKDKEKLHKMCNFWGWDKDATLDIQIYSNDKKLRKLSKFLETKTDNQDGTSSTTHTISYDDVAATDFTVHKHTFHPSGFIHTTNPQDERYESGIRSIPFEKIESAHLLTIIFPKNSTLYPEIQNNELGENDIILDTKTFQNSPFQIGVYIVRGKNEPPVNPKASVTADIICGENEDLKLFVRCEQTPEMISKPFPPYTFIGTPVYDKKEEL